MNAHDEVRRIGEAIQAKADPPSWRWSGAREQALPVELVSLVAGPVWPCGAARVASWAVHQRVCAPCGEVPF